MSAFGSAATKAAQPSAVPRSPATPRTLASGWPFRIAAIARSTAAWLRPLTTTVAPAAARPLAMAKPMPAVEPLTIASLSLRSICMGVSCRVTNRSGTRLGEQTTA